MNIKPIALEKLINDEINDLKRGFHESSTVAIHEEDGIQVQIVVTKDEYDFSEEIYPACLEATT